MSKKISIIIPRYKETEYDILPLFCSITAQTGISMGDIEVVVGNDGGGNGELNDDFTNMFPFSVKQVQLEENKGPGIARQVAIDAAEGEYLMFSDADDEFHNACVLKAVMDEIEVTGPDVMATSWLEETLLPNGQYSYIPHEFDLTWMHGKVIRRNFLKNENIRFHDDLRVHEDSYFLSLCGSLTKREMRYMAACTSYVWRFKPNSITRHDDGIYTYDSFATFIKACTMAYTELERRNIDIQEKVVQLSIYVYFSLHAPHWLAPEHEKYRIECEEATKEHIGPKFKYYLSAPNDMISRVYNSERQKHFKDGIEEESFMQWAERLGLC